MSIINIILLYYIVIIIDIITSIISTEKLYIANNNIMMYASWIHLYITIICWAGPIHKPLSKNLFHQWRK